MDITNRNRGLELRGNYKFLVFSCIALSSLGYLADGYKQKSTNACLKRIEKSKQSSMSAFQAVSKTSDPAERRLAAQYMGYLSQNSEKVCDGL